MHRATRSHRDHGDLQMDSNKFAEFCSLLYYKWQVDQTFASGCDSIVFLGSPKEEEQGQETLHKNVALRAGMPQLRQSEWMMAFVGKRIFLLANSDRAKASIKCMYDRLPVSFDLKVEVLSRDKADKNKANFSTIVNALKSCNAGKKVGCIVREKSSGTFSSVWQSTLEQGGMEIEDISESLWEMLNSQNELSKAAMVSCERMSDVSESEAGGIGVSCGKKRKVPEKMSKLQESLLRALECSVCMNVMVAPVFQCQSGHSICKMCVEKVSKCPMCRCEMHQRIRNLSLEQMAEGIDGFACMHAAQGCREVVSYGELENHQRSCGYGPVACPWAWYRRSGPRPCSWHGPASALIEHLHAKHQERSSKLNMEPAAHQMADSWSHRVLIEHPHQSYTANFEAALDPKKPQDKVFFRMDHRGKDQMSFTCVRYMGVSSTVSSASNDWFCELTAGRYSKQDPTKICSRRAMWSGRVHPVGHTPRELREAGEGLFLQASQVRLLAEREKSCESDGNGGSVLIHLRFFRDEEAAGKLALPPMQERTVVDTDESESDSEEEDEDEEDEEDEEQDHGIANASHNQQLLHALYRLY